MRWARDAVLGFVVFAISGPAVAAETVTYTYDALGRLTQVNTAGGVNNGVVTGTCFDPAGNRMTYSVGSSVPAACASFSPLPTGSSPPPPPSPVTQPDSLSVGTCGNGSVNVVSNDSDPGGNYPLTLIAVSGASLGTASVSNASTVRYHAGGAAGGDEVTYTIRNAAGVTATGVVEISVSDQGGCQ